MDFDTTNLNPGTWFNFDATDEKAGRVCLRVCDGTALRTIKKKTVEKKAEVLKVDNVVSRVAYDDVKEDEQEDLIWDYCIIDWEGVLDANKEPIPCTKENKLLLINGSVKFASLIGKFLKVLAEEIKTAEEKSTKK